MDDCIKRIDALQSLEKSMNLNQMRERLKRLPAADVRPVKRGRYEATQFEALFSTMVCSACFNRVPIGYFCYMCGAEMGGTDK